MVPPGSAMMASILGKSNCTPFLPGNLGFVAVSLGSTAVRRIPLTYPCLPPTCAASFARETKDRACHHRDVKGGARCCFRSRPQRSSTPGNRALEGGRSDTDCLPGPAERTCTISMACWSCRAVCAAAARICSSLWLICCPCVGYRRSQCASIRGCDNTQEQRAAERPPSSGALRLLRKSWRSCPALILCIHTVVSGSFDVSRPQSQY